MSRAKGFSGSLVAHALYQAILFPALPAEPHYYLRGVCLQASPDPVDAGLLGAAPVDVPDGSPEPGGVTVETFDEDFVCGYDSRTGVARFGHILIRTAG